MPAINSRKYPTIDKGYSIRGADMGRADWNGEPQNKSVRVFHLPIDGEGYDIGGAYWGLGEPLYCATDGLEFRRFVRARSRAEAIAALNLPEGALKRS